MVMVLPPIVLAQAAQQLQSVITERNKVDALVFVKAFVLSVE